MASIKRDDTKQAWEGGDDDEFPLVCETCLGDNPYVRMTKEKHGKKCQVCETPFTVFAWQAGTKGRLKKVEICRNCARARNVCQVCVYDLKYGLPVKVRDKVLRESGGKAGGGPGGSDAPQSLANRAWNTAQQQRMIEQGQTVGDDTSDLAHAQLAEMAQMKPRYERNLPKLCSFFARGECDRGDSCPFRHEMPRDRNDPMAQQSTKDRFYGTNDPVANKILGRKRQQDHSTDRKDERQGYNKARATLFLTLQRRQQGPGGGSEPPPPLLAEADVRDAFYAFGEIVSVRVLADRGQAFVEYTSPDACELAIASTNRKPLKVGGQGGQQQQMRVAWAKAPKRGDEDDEDAVGGRNSGGNNRRSGGGGAKPPAAIQPLAPPAGPTKPIPKGVAAVKLPPEVAAIAASRKQQKVEAGSGPRPGHYPSADPNRLGTKS